MAILNRGRIGRPSIMEHLEKKQNNKCNICKTPLEKRGVHVDHIIPLKKGGEDLLKNMQLLCVRCHKKKTKEEGYSIGGTKEETYVEVCKYCGKVFETFHKNQAKNQLLIHKINRHSDKIEIKEKK